MGQPIAKIVQGGKVELFDQNEVKIAGIDPMTPLEAALLGRSLLACGAVVSLEATPKINYPCTDVHFPVLEWTLGAQTKIGDPVAIFSVPPGIDLTFQMTLQVEKAIGAALVAHAAGHQPPEQSPGKVR